MNIGLFDVDSHNFPNLPLMKISAWHKARGDSVEFVLPLKHYDKIYVSKVFGDEYSEMPISCLQADEIVYGGTGFAITVENGKEVYHKDRDPVLPDEIEHIYHDYSLYPELTKREYAVKRLLICQSFGKGRKILNCLTQTCLLAKTEWNFCNSSQIVRRT